MHPWLVAISIGAVAGFLAGALIRGRTLKLLSSVVVGVIGGALGGWCVRLLGFQQSPTLLLQLLTSTVGAAALLYVVGAFAGEG